QSPALFDLDLHYLQLIGVGMLLGFDDARDTERTELLSWIGDALDLEADSRQLRRNLLDGRLGLEVVLEPGQRELHRRSLQCPSSVLRRREEISNQLESPPPSVGVSSIENP